MNNVSEILKEGDLGFSEDIFRASTFMVESAPNASDNHIFCFKVMDLNTPGEYRDLNICRINMMRPEYIGAEEETLILSESQIEEMIQKFNEPSEYFDGNNWQYMIDCMNFISGKDRQLSLDLPIPDYRLLTKEVKNDIKTKS